MSKLEDPRISAWIVLLVGTGITIAANILHAEAHFWPRVISGAVPFVLFLTAHTAAYARGWLVRCTMIAVSVLAFAVSYDHMNALMMSYGEQYAVAKIYPLVFDGVLLVAVLTLATYRPNVVILKPVVEEHDDEPNTFDNASAVRGLWPDGLLLSEDVPEKAVRAALNKLRREAGLKAISQNQAASLVRDYTKEYAS